MAVKEHRDNRACTITNLLYKGTEKTWGKEKLLDAIGETYRVERHRTVPDGVDRLVSMCRTFTEPSAFDHAAKEEAILLAVSAAGLTCCTRFLSGISAR